MREAPITPHEMLVGPGEKIHSVYFPLTGVISLMTPLQNGVAIETATVGMEGMVGIPAFLGGKALDNSQALSQVPGRMLTMDIETFRAETDGDTNGNLLSIMMAYSQALFAQIAQAVACNAAHEIEQRTAKWLLQTHDRVEGDTFALTQEFLADMLGVTRPSVSVAARGLQRAGLITYRRGGITVLDRAALEEASCECYETVRRVYEQLLGNP
ncbi:MAG: Crp/Fnr family transcriptional regulator [Actinomycetota bacterium]|nr:Crp/Fnr family transcriptional regulator [Actinomycetota bacterium]